jgi:nucleosome assembly protein 1-like 1
MEAMEEGNVDEEELEDLDEKLEMDYQIGEDLKERVSRVDLSESGPAR